MSGFGSQKFGTSPYGLGTPAVAPYTGGGVLLDVTGAPTGSRAIDAFKRDYVIGSNGRYLGMTDTNHLVYMAVATVKGSSAWRALGQELPLIPRITTNFVRRADATLRACVQHIVNAGLITVIDTSVDIVRPGVVKARLRWRDVSTGNEQTTDV